MFKRSTKITSLLVAAASVATMVPAMAADKIADKDGVVYYGVAYKDGKLYVDGKDVADANDKDGIFYFNGSDKKAKEVDSDIDSGDEVTGTYGSKYVEIQDGDYYVDLETGKVTDDSLRKDDREDAASELRKKIRKDDPSRYDEEYREKVADVDTDKYNKNGQIWEVPAAAYTTPYYQVNYLKFADGKHDFVLNDTATVYTDEKGKYIDADNDLGKLNVIIKKTIPATTDDALKINVTENTNQYEAISFDEVGSKKNKNKDFEVGVYVGHVQTLGSDADNIYRLVKLKIKAAIVPYKDGKVDPDYDFKKDATTQPAVAFGSTKNPVWVEADADGFFYAIQKISKAQGDDKDDAKLPKTTATYLTTDYKDYRKNQNKYVSFKDNKEIREVYEKSGKDDYDIQDDNYLFTVADGKVTVYENDYITFSDSASNKNGNGDNYKVWTWSLKNSNGYYYLGQDDNGDEFEDENEFAVTVDSKGNIWKLDSGKIYKYNNKGGYDLKYKCDGGLNELSVYDDDNLIAYNEDDDVYAIVGGKSSTGKYKIDNGEQQQTTTTAQAGWVQDATTGAWSYVKADGTKAIGWFQSPTSGLWYYMDANGIMKANGWIQDGGSWYFLDATGAMKTGWVYTGGAWYYLKETAGNKGAMQTGWISWKGKWYYCNASGAMLKNTTVGGYVLGADGAWVK